MTLAMHKKTITEIARTYKPKVVVEVGLKASTKNLLPIFQSFGAHYHGIDPVRCCEIPHRLKQYFTYHQGISLEVLPKIENIDCVMLDGDHTYYTVLHELKLLHTLLRLNGIILFHDVEPPWDRKDLYYNRDLIPKEFQDGPKQGVLTAIEDFLSEFGEYYTPLTIHSGHHGLGILRKIK